MSLFPEEMTSDRLRYTALRPDTMDPFELYTHTKADAPGIDRVTRFLFWDPYQTPKEAADWIGRCGDVFERNEEVTYIVRPTAGSRSGAFAGLTGLQVDWDRRMATLGMWLLPPFWGNGYSRERAGRLFELAFDRLDLEVVAVTADPENERSISSIEGYIDQYGGRREGVIRNDLVVDGEPRDSVRFSVTATEWAEAVDHS